MFKFLPGILFIQLVTAGLVFVAINWSHDPELVVIMALFALATAMLAGFWFVAIARDMHKQEQAQMLEQHALDRERILHDAQREKAVIASEKSQIQEQFAREREKILVEAEREKASIIADSYRFIARETQKAHAKANFKVGAAFVLAASAGGILLFSQLITIGSMLLVASGSGLAGYLVRARYDRLSRNKQLAIVNQTLQDNSHDASAKTPKRLSKD